MSIRHKYDHAREWLDGYIDRAIAEARGGNLNDLIRIVNELKAMTDSDQIQDEFQDEMEKDGFFDNLNADDRDTVVFFRHILRENPKATLNDARQMYDECGDADAPEGDYVKFVGTIFGTHPDVDPPKVWEKIDEELGRLERVYADNTAEPLSEMLEASELPPAAPKKGKKKAAKKK
jgi:hypothetical protein